MQYVEFELDPTVNVNSNVVLIRDTFGKHQVPMVFSVHEIDSLIDELSHAKWLIETKGNSSFGDPLPHQPQATQMPMPSLPRPSMLEDDVDNWDDEAW